MFCPYAFGKFAVDIALVSEPPCSVIKQKLMADSALRRRKKYRTSIDLVIAWCDRLDGVRPLGQIFLVHEHAEREKSRNHNNRVQGTTAARPDTR